MQSTLFAFDFARPQRSLKKIGIKIHFVGDYLKVLHSVSSEAI